MGFGKRRTVHAGLVCAEGAEFVQVGKNALALGPGVILTHDCLALLGSRSLGGRKRGVADRDVAGGVLGNDPVADDPRRNEALLRASRPNSPDVELLPRD